MPYIALAKKNLLINSFLPAQLNYCLQMWMIHSRFTNNGINYLSTWKMSSSGFLLLDKNKNYNYCYKSHKISNLVLNPNFILILIPKPQNQTFPGPRIKVAEPDKNLKINTKKQNCCDLHLNWTIIIFESFVLSYCDSYYEYF